MQVVCDHRHLANVSAKCKSLPAIWRTSPRNARAFPTFGETLREMQEAFRRLANLSAKCKSISAVWRTSPRNARAFPPFGERLLQLAGDYRTPTYHLLQSAGDLRTPTNISCNLRETFVPLQTSPATCGRLSYPYEHLLQSAGDLRTPTKKCFSIFFAYDLCFLSKALLLFH